MSSKVIKDDIVYDKDYIIGKCKDNKSSTSYESHSDTCVNFFNSYSDELKSYVTSELVSGLTKSSYVGLCIGNCDIVSHYTFGLNCDESIKLKDEIVEVVKDDLKKSGFYVMDGSVIKADLMVSDNIFSILWNYAMHSDYLMYYIVIIFCFIMMASVTILGVK